MKTYENPTLAVLSVSANDMLCACSITTRNSTDPVINWLTAKWGGSDGLLDPSDPVFASESDSCSEFYEGYCKFTTTDNVLFTS